MYVTSFFSRTQLTLFQPIIFYGIIYHGPASEELEYAAPIKDLNPIPIGAGEVPMPALAAMTYMGVDSVGCAYGNTVIRHPIGTKTYNVASIRKMYDEFDSTLNKHPELKGSFFLLEGYSTQAVKALPEESTAFPHRSDELLLSPVVLYSRNATMDAIAVKFGATLRQILLEGTDDPIHMRAYVNYAHGDESLQAMYGWEEWRLTKLRDLKKKWDPENRMRYYNPIV